MRMEPKSRLLPLTQERFFKAVTSPVGVGWGVGLAFAAFFIATASPARCVDGWASPSIGIRGACPHHGGVAGSWLPFELIFSVFLGFAASVLRNRPIEKRRIAEQKAFEERVAAEAKAQAAAEGIACPLCGFPLRQRRAYKGKNRGWYFMGCSRYPHCKGARHLTPEEESNIPERSPRGGPLFQLLRHREQKDHLETCKILDFCTANVRFLGDLIRRPSRRRTPALCELC